MAGKRTSNLKTFNIETMRDLPLLAKRIAMQVSQTRVGANVTFNNASLFEVTAGATTQEVLTQLESSAEELGSHGRRRHSRTCGL